MGKKSSERNHTLEEICHWNQSYFFETEHESLASALGWQGPYSSAFFCHFLARLPGVPTGHDNSVSPGRPESPHLPAPKNQSASCKPFFSADV